MTTIQYRRGTASQWTTANPTLAAGEPGFETDTGKYKIGDGTKNWATLGYAKSGANSAVDYGMSISSDLTFTNSVTSFTGAAATTLGLASSISSTAAKATVWETSRKLNSVSVNGSSDVVVPGAIYGTAASTSANFRNIYVAQTAPSAPANGDVWISW